MTRRVSQVWASSRNSWTQWRQLQVVTWSKNPYSASFWSWPSSGWLHLSVAPALSNLALAPGLCFSPSYSFTPLKWPEGGQPGQKVGDGMGSPDHSERPATGLGEGRCCCLTQTCEIPLHPTPTRKQGSGPQHSQPRHVVSSPMLKVTTMLLSRAGNFCWALITWQEPY